MNAVKPITYLESCLLELINRLNELSVLNDRIKLVYDIDSVKENTYQSFMLKINARIDLFFKKLTKLSQRYNENSATFLYAAIARENKLLSVYEDILLQDPPFEKWWEQL